MKLPKLTRTRFILLWCASVLTFFFIGWRFILKRDEVVASIQRIPVTGTKWDFDTNRHNQKIADRPSSVIDIKNENNAPHRLQILEASDEVQHSQPDEESDSEEETQSIKSSFLPVSHSDSNRKKFDGSNLWNMQTLIDTAQMKNMPQTKPSLFDNSAKELSKSRVVLNTSQQDKRFSEEKNELNKGEGGIFNQKRNIPSLAERNQFVTVPSKAGFPKDQIEYKNSPDINNKNDVLLETPNEKMQAVLGNRKHVQPRTFHPNLEREFKQFNLQPVNPTVKLQTTSAERISPFHTEKQHVQSTDVVQRHEMVAYSKTDNSLNMGGKQEGSQSRERETHEKENVRFQKNDVASDIVSAHHPRITKVVNERLANTVSMKVDTQALHIDQPLNLPNVILNQPQQREKELRTGSTRNSYTVSNVRHQTVEQAPVEVMPAKQPVLPRGDVVHRKVRPEDETDQEFLQRIEERQVERHARIRQICQNKYGLSLLDFQRDRQKILSWKKYFEHAYANDDHQFIICRVLKVASFSWRKVMISLYGKGSQVFRRSQKQGDFPMMDYDDEKFMSKLENYKRILFVRDPFARFLSAYRDKYIELRHFPYYRPIGMNIIRKYRKSPSQAEIMSGRPTFEEFTRWVIAEETPEGDFHWRPLFSVYHPCEINYDYIGKLETAAEDAKYVFKMIGIDGIETFPSTEMHHKFSSSAEVLKEFYSQLPPELLPKLIERYCEEFDLFDYPMPQTFSDIWTRAES